MGHQMESHGGSRSLVRAVDWTPDGTGIVWTVGLSEADAALLAEAIQTGEVIEVPTALGARHARVTGLDVQQVWGGPNVPFYRLQGALRAEPDG